MSAHNYTTTALLLAALDAIIALAILLSLAAVRRRQGRQATITLGGLLTAGMAMGIACAVKLMVLGRNGWHLFGQINAVYTEVVLGLPLLCAVLIVGSMLGRWWWPRLKLTGPTTVLAVAGLLPAVVGFYTSCIEPYRLVLDEVTVPLAENRHGSEPLRVGFISDIQTPAIGEHEESAIRLLMEQRPDVILVGGDLFQGRHQDFEQVLPGFRRLHASMTAPGGVYCVLGNVDSRFQVEQTIKNTAVRLLYNEIAEVKVKDRHLLVAGLTGNRPGSAEKEVVRRLETMGDPGDIRIVLSHWPDIALDLPPDSCVDLVVSGHTHGGQIRLPLIGPLMNASSIPRRMAGGGLFELQGHLLYVNRGIGYEHSQAPPMRFLCPPTVSILELTNRPGRTAIRPQSQQSGTGL